MTIGDLNANLSWILPMLGWVYQLGVGAQRLKSLEKAFEESKLGTGKTLEKILDKLEDLPCKNAEGCPYHRGGAR